MKSLRLGMGMLVLLSVTIVPIARGQSDLQATGEIRFAIVGGEGVFLIFNAVVPADRLRDPVGYVGYWRNYLDETLYVFDRLLFTPEDVGHALIGLELDFGLDAALLASVDPLVVEALNGARQAPPDSSVWVSATEARIAAIMGFGDTGRLDEIITVSAEECFCTESVGPGPGGALILPVQANPPAPPPGLSFDDNMLVVIQAVCAPEGCPEPPGGGTTDPCAGVNCDDGNPCTSDSCTNGACAHTVIDDPCCDGSLSAALERMGEGIEALVDAEGMGTSVKVEEPSVTETGVSSQLAGYDSGDLTRVGALAVGCGSGGNSVTLSVDMEAREGGGVTASWSLSLELWEDGDVLHMWGTLEFVDIPGMASGTLVGGWIYSDAAGPAFDPASDPGFHDEVARMWNVVQPDGGGAAAAAAASLGTVLEGISNALQLAIHYLLDLLIPYTPPTSCTGPTIESTCSADQPPCQDSLDQICADSIDEIPDVSTAFKQCMKGRCGCGGSSHPQARVVCSPTDDCGPCGFAGGCNLAGGSKLWYCQPSPGTIECLCVNTVFHEMAHACGLFDDPDCEILNQCPAPDSEEVSGACAVGTWFQEQCCPDIPRGQ